MVPEQPSPTVAVTGYKCCMFAMHKNLQLSTSLCGSRTDLRSMISSSWKQSCSLDDNIICSARVLRGFAAQAVNQLLQCSLVWCFSQQHCCQDCSAVSHIKHLKEKCTKALNLLRVIAHTTWGADQQTLLHPLQGIDPIKAGLWVYCVWLCSKLLPTNVGSCSKTRTSAGSWSL